MVGAYTKEITWKTGSKRGAETSELTLTQPTPVRLIHSTKQHYSHARVSYPTFSKVQIAQRVYHPILITLGTKPPTHGNLGENSHLFKP
jgi:hypothetical protein